MLCQKWTARSMVMLIVAVWAVLGTSGSSLANQTFWEALWKSAFQQPYVHGRSGILLGSQQQPGVFELLVYDAVPGAITVTPVGTVTVHGTWAVAWRGDDNAAIESTVNEVPVTGVGTAAFTTISATVSTFTGFTTPVVAFGSNVSMELERAGESGQYTFSTFTPIQAYSTIEKADTAAQALSQSFNDIPFIPVTPGDDSQAACIARCHNDYLRDLQIAENDLNGRLSRCTWWRGAAAGCGGGCAVCGVIGTGIGGPPGGGVGCAACCITGGILGGIFESTQCSIDARTQYINDLNNASARFKACMAGCGVVIVEM